MILSIKKITLLVLVFFVARPIDNFDIWWHLNSGLWMLENGRILDHDVWSFTMEGAPWINISWLFQLLIAFSYLLGGLWGLFIFKAICIFIVFSLIAASLNPQNIHRYITSYFLAFLVLLPFIYSHLHLRPNLLEIIVLLTLVLLSQRFCSFRIVCIGFLTLIFLANSHASVIVGSVAFALFILFGKWEYEVSQKTKITSALLILSTPYLTPSGIDILTLLFAHDGSDLIKYYVGEWVRYGAYPLGLWLVFSFALLFSLNKKIKVNITESFLLLFFLWYSFKYQRFELELAILLLRPLTEVIGYGLYKIDYGKKLPILIAILFLLVHGILYSNQLFNLAPSLYLDIPANKFKYPTTTVKQLEKLSDKLDRNINVINDYDYGGYIALFSKSKVLIDGRMSTLYPESLLITPYESDPVILKRLAQRYNADAILLKLDKSSLISVDDPDWQMTAYDPASVLFIKRALIADMDVPSINYNPSQYISAYDSHDLQVHKKETLSLLALEPDNPVALNHMAVFLSTEIDSVKSRQAVFDYLKQSIKLSPKDIFSKATYAYILATTSTDVKSITSDFFKYLPPANKLTSGISLSYDLVFSRVLIDLGLAKEALAYLYPETKARRYNIDKLMDAWKLRIIAHTELGKIKKAKNCLSIAYELADDDDQVEIGTLDNLARLIDAKS